MTEAAARGDLVETGRLRGVLHDIQRLTVRTSILAGQPPGWRLLVLELLLNGATRAHLIHDGHLIRSVSRGISALPSDPAGLEHLADQIIGAEADDDYEHDELWPGDATTPERDASPRLDPDEPAIVLRWLAQARLRLEVALLPALNPAGIDAGTD